MKGTSPLNNPVPFLLEELQDSLLLLYRCRKCGVVDVDRLEGYIEETLDEIEYHCLGMSRELFLNSLSVGQFGSNQKSAVRLTRKIGA